jgi:GNAT superfamily N-acetyltransferase
MLYPENERSALTRERFQSPGAEYRAAPFWAWNCALNQESLNREIDAMKEMGFGGFHMHVRVGMSTEYMSDAFLAFIRGCCEHARGKEMLAWLYDEDKWPSGFGGGLVTKEPALRQKFLLFTAKAYGAGAETTGNDSSARPARAENGERLATYAVRLDSAGCLADYKRLQAGEAAPAGYMLRYTYLETQLPSPWFNLQSYVDTLAPEAIAKFIEVTHERYLKAVGADFGGLIPAIFTDEPQFTRKQTLPSPTAEQDCCLPWTTDFASSFQAAYGAEILDALPELFWELPGGRISQTRYRYHDHVAERFAGAFADQIGAWCGKHSLMLTGHMMEEDTLRSQTAALGDCMRSYRGFQLPGIDMLCDERNLNTAKQAQSAARQYARPGVLSELYGVTNWDFPFRKHKLQGDWQAALGVSVRVPHLYWVSMRGEAKRDYPASIGHQSPWYKEYKYLEDHFARVNAAMTRGKPLVRIGVIHPVESYWLHWGPETQTREARSEMDSRFSRLTEWLLRRQLDFDFICESLLPTQYDAAGEGFAVGAMHYDVILVPQQETIRATTLDALHSFVRKGGSVFFFGSLPTHVDALENPAAQALLTEGAAQLPWSRARLYDALAPYGMATVSCGQGMGEYAENLISQWRAEADGSRWFFLCHVRDESDYYKTGYDERRITLRGRYAVELYDTLTGEISSIAARVQNGETTVLWHAYPQDSLLLRLTPLPESAADGGTAGVLCAGIDAQNGSRAALPPVCAVTLEEPNVLVLDMPQYALDGEALHPREEVLRICDACKQHLGLQNDIARGCQPWVLAGDADAAPTHTLLLRHTVASDVEVAAAQLAIEDLEALRLRWNGAEIPTKAEGWYVDEAFQTVTLPGGIHCGENVLEITIPFGKVTTVESSYLLGDFGVRVAGSGAKITAPVHTLAWGDWVSQGLPFYGGNVVYHAEITGDGMERVLEAHHFAQPALSAALDGEPQGIIALAPWRVRLGKPAAGKHKLAVTAYGNRSNTFGALHNVHYAERWHGPHAFRSAGENWSYEYRLRPSGILVAPEICCPDGAAWFRLQAHDLSEIRPLTAEQLPEYAEVIRKSFATVAHEFGWTKGTAPTFTAYITDEQLAQKIGGGYYAFGLCVKDKIVGFVSLTDKGDGVFEMNHLSVIWRHYGYGKRLMKYCKDKVRELGGNKIAIGIVEENTALKDWYAANGFVHTSTKKFENLPFTTGYMEWRVAE